MPPKEKYSDPKLREEVKEDIKQGDKGGEPGQWSARKAQMMAKEYKKRGGDYNQPKSNKDESAKNLDQWGEEDWQTKEGSGDAKKDDGSHKRYLPKKAWEQMSEKEKTETDDKKLEESKEGTQYVENTGKAKKARKDAKVEEDKEQEKDDDAKENKTPRRSQRQTTSSNQAQSEKQKSNQAKKDEGNEESEKSDNDDQQEKQATSAGRKRKQTNDSKSEETPKKQKTSTPKSKSKENATVGSKHDSSEAPAKQGSTSRLPKKGQKKVHWKAMPGWVEGEVVEIVEKDKEVDGKKVKASKQEPKVVLKSKSSGKICVHKADNVYFD